MVSREAELSVAHCVKSFCEDAMICLIWEAADRVNIIIIKIDCDVVGTEREVVKFVSLRDLPRLAKVARLTLEIIYIFNLIRWSLASYFSIRFKTSLRLDS